MDFLDALYTAILTAPRAFVYALDFVQGKQSEGQWCPTKMVKSTPVASTMSLDKSRIHDLA